MTGPVPPTFSQRFQNRHIIVGTGFAVGIAGVLGYLPAISFAGSSAPYVWAAIIGFGAFTWYKEYHERARRMNEKLQKGFVRTPDYDYRQTGAPSFQPSDAGKSPALAMQEQPQTQGGPLPPVNRPVLPQGDTKLFDDFDKVDKL